MKIDSCWTLELVHNTRHKSQAIIIWFVRIRECVWSFLSSVVHCVSTELLQLQLLFAIIHHTTVSKIVDLFDATICRFSSTRFQFNDDHDAVLLWIALSLQLCVTLPLLGVGGVDHIASLINQDKQLVSSLRRHTNNRFLFSIYKSIHLAHSRIVCVKCETNEEAKKLFLLLFHEMMDKRGSESEFTFTFFNAQKERARTPKVDRRRSNACTCMRPLPVFLLLALDLVIISLFQPRMVESRRDGERERETGEEKKNTNENWKVEQWQLQTTISTYCLKSSYLQLGNCVNIIFYLLCA